MIKKSFENIIKSTKDALDRSENKFVVFIKKNRTPKATIIFNFALTFLILILSFSVYNAKLLAFNDFVLTPSEYARSLEIYELEIATLALPYVTYYVIKYFFTFYIIVVGLCFAGLAYLALVRPKNISKKTNLIILVLLSNLLIATLISYHNLNVYDCIASGIEFSSNIKNYFIFCIIFFIIKLIINPMIDSEFMANEVKESGISLAYSFGVVLFVIVCLFTPLYIFPGTINRISGFDLVTGNYGVLAFLQVNDKYRSLMVFLIIVSVGSFIISFICFTFFKRAYVYVRMYGYFIGIATLIVYALIGLSYFVVYIDCQGYLEYLETKMNTYSYIPLGFFISYAVGIFISKLVLNNIIVLYQVDGIKNNRRPNEVVNQNNNSDEVLDPIPAFSELDLLKPSFDLEYQQRLTNSLENPTLLKVVNHIINYARYSKEKLSYGQIEIKTFIAGLAASRLSILQGMSGTGKTSLPKIFMEAIDGICDLVAVESSWRDKNELLGYYNEFNKKYTPKVFTQFLYKAVLNPDVPYFIVLDEMNLSRIEYYFADFLSLMEASEDKRFIKLFDVQLYPEIDERDEYLVLKNGHTIKIPKNLWFIGTANRDESTFEISDKVYDRAQTINFDKRAPKVLEPTSIDYPKKFISYSVLKQLFDEALDNLVFDAERNPVINRVETILKPYKISFGNRILKQIEEFVKVYVACSDCVVESDKDKYIHEALDCILLSKIVRKLELKQMVDLELLIDEFSDLGLNRCLEFINSLSEIN